jgi:hypothetical protein
LADLEEVIERYHQALDEFAKGDPAPVKALYARRGHHAREPVRRTTGAGLD